MAGAVRRAADNWDHYGKLTSSFMTDSYHYRVALNHEYLPLRSRRWATDGSLYNITVNDSEK
jgi:hypothetical protein